MRICITAMKKCCNCKPLTALLHLKVVYALCTNHIHLPFDKESTGKLGASTRYDDQWIL